MTGLNGGLNVGVFCPGSREQTSGDQSGSERKRRRTSHGQLNATFSSPSVTATFTDLTAMCPPATTLGVAGIMGLSGRRFSSSRERDARLNRADCLDSGYAAATAARGFQSASEPVASGSIWVRSVPGIPEPLLSSEGSPVTAPAFRNGLHLCFRPLDSTDTGRRDEACC